MRAETINRRPVDLEARLTHLIKAKRTPPAVRKCARLLTRTPEYVLRIEKLKPFFPAHELDEDSAFTWDLAFRWDLNKTPANPESRKTMTLGTLDARADAFADECGPVRAEYLRALRESHRKYKADLEVGENTLLQRASTMICSSLVFALANASWAVPLYPRTPKTRRRSGGER